MVLKESFRYQNFLDNMFRNVTRFLENESYVTTTTESHNRSKSNADATDEVVVAEKYMPYDITVDEAVALAEYLVNEMCKLAKAISIAKVNCDIDIDSTLFGNKKRQQLADAFKRMANMKNTTRKSVGKDYCFNINNEQVEYSYEVVKETTVDFDRNDISEKSKKILELSDNLSSEIDKYNVMVEVEYFPLFNCNDSLEDCVKKLLNK